MPPLVTIRALLPVIILQESRFIQSAAKQSQAPAEDPAWPEITLVGRSNVGKSSLINCLFQRKNLARTSNTPGKTRLLNFYEVRFKLEPSVSKLPAPVASSALAKPDAVTPLPPSTETSYQLRLVDLPGYGYAKVSQKEQAQWRKELEGYLRQRQSLSLVLQLLDARHGAKPNDVQMFEWLQSVGIDPLLVLTKADKVKQSDLAGIRRQVSKTLLVEPGYVLPFSATSQLNRNEVWERVLGAVGYLTG